ncbi:ribose ABC transporter permease [Luteimicrobium album]|uniref:Ribose ABC transporter permease n=1 Tax=Luteimicrobium album TaxID=1054550 RepID=A0ABQ6I2G4_9MICO|nr:ABC transporter permease [Luteimicrobium album]GMA24422.1 ribose ABC transporter permease [Luteimicrobium album]
MSSTKISTRRRTVNPQAVGVVAATVLIFVVFSVLSPAFLGLDNLRDLAISACVNAIIGLGLTFVIITGGIDLSVGSTASFVGVVSATLMVKADMPSIPAIAVGLVIGCLCGALNGILITRLRLQPFIVTLGTMSVYQGLAYVVTNGVPVYNIPADFTTMLNGYVGGVPVMVIIVLVLGVLAWALLRRTLFGENVLATGGSDETAWLSGVRVARVKVLVYMIAGGCAALAGLILVARIDAAQTDGGSPYLLTAIASAVIGGANLMGGEGRISGTLLGALILAALTNGLVLLNVPSFYEQIVTGVVVVLAVSLDRSAGYLRFLRRPPSRSGSDAQPVEQEATA